MTNTTKIGRRGQITIPRAVRNWLQIDEGDRIAFIQQGDRVLIQPLTQTLLDLRGSIAVDGPQNFGVIRQYVLSAHGRGAAKDEA